MEIPSPSRVITYIDGFNLYFGLKTSSYRRFYWLDMEALSLNLLKPNQRLQAVKYFTARIAGPRPCDSEAKTNALKSKCQRQTTYLDSLATRSMLTIFEGHYLAKPITCRNCGN
ncbi:MAG TPA: NYN domain-containing protein, partial [Phycisphaerae bacterium]|nr:NYN domain-containing protein [Phycisphaerae bacterium]